MYEDKTTEALNRLYLLGILNGNVSMGGGGEEPSTARASITKAVTTAGTPVKASDTSVPCDYCFISPLTKTNTGSVYWGINDTMVSHNIPTGGVRLTGIITNLNQLYLDSDVNLEGVLITYATT